MSKKHKWVKVTTIDGIKVGDKVRAIDGALESRFVADELSPDRVHDADGRSFHIENYEAWYVRRPKKATPVMPVEPPVGTFFRVDRTSDRYVRVPDTYRKSHYRHHFSAMKVTNTAGVELIRLSHEELALIMEYQLAQAKAWKAANEAVQLGQEMPDEWEGK